MYLNANASRAIGTTLAALVAAVSLAACGGGGAQSSAPVVPQTYARQPVAQDATQISAVDDSAIQPDATCAPPPDPATLTFKLTGKAQSVTLPCFKDIHISAVVPANNSTTAKPITVVTANSSDKNLGAKPSTTLGTVIGYVSLSPSATVNFTPSTAAIASTTTSVSKIIAGHTYPFQVQVKEFNDAVIQSGTATLNAAKHSVSIGVKPPGGTFNGGLHAIVVLYRK